MHARERKGTANGSVILRRSALCAR